MSTPASKIKEYTRTESILAMVIFIILITVSFVLGLPLTLIASLIILVIFTGAIIQIITPLVPKEWRVLLAMIIIAIMALIFGFVKEAVLPTFAVSGNILADTILTITLYAVLIAVIIVIIVYFLKQTGLIKLGSTKVVYDGDWVEPIP